LDRAVRSGGYLVPPHASDYEMRESAATDPYTRCGMRKRLCISNLDQFLVHHMPNSYADVLGTDHDEFWARVDSLRRAPGG
jgi:hypothetical protein